MLVERFERQRAYVCDNPRVQSGGPNRNCTCDPRVISTVLCSLSYRPLA